MQAEDAGHKKTRGTRLRELRDRTEQGGLLYKARHIQSGSSSPAPQRRAACVSSRNSPSDSAGGDGRAIHRSERSSIQRSASSCAHDMRKLLLRTFAVPKISSDEIGLDGRAYEGEVAEVDGAVLLSTTS